MDNIAYFTPKGQNQEYAFAIYHEKDNFILRSIENNQDGSSLFSYTLTLQDNRFYLEKGGYFEESEEVINEKLLALSLGWIERYDIGVDDSNENSFESSQEPTYSVEDIIVENKPFSLKQLYDLIKSGDLEVAPEFQRNFIWDRTRQSRLIESLLLGLPTPSIYLSQYSDGMLTVVDGLQRITTIQRFLDNELVLSNLEYLKHCNGCTYATIQSVLSPLRLRRFGQTQIMCFVIDYRSPQALKYDLFRRLNTGGQPLNNQEIRNCLSRKPLQSLLKSMIEDDNFLKATDYSIRNIRMEAQELALKFICFYNKYNDATIIESYDGSMDATLNNEVDLLNKKLAQTPETSDVYLQLFSDAMDLSEIFFGQYAFRKIFPGYDKEGQRRYQINKSLFVAIAVIIAKHIDTYQKLINSGVNLKDSLANLIQNDIKFFNSITWSTNSKTNMTYVFTCIKEMFDKALETNGNEK